MEIIRINTYYDDRFSQKILNQHGCFLVDNLPHEVEIFSDHEAIVRGKNISGYLNLIEEFRFYAPHITKFYDENQLLIKEYPNTELLKIAIDKIQPSQFYVDEEKVAAIQDFIWNEDDIVIQVIPYQGKYISLDGHTRLYYAVLKEWKHVRAVVEKSDDWVYKFAEEAKKEMSTLQVI